MNNPKILLRDILLFKDDLEKEGMDLPPSLAGMYGEILVYQKLLEIFGDSKYKINFFAKQKASDIQLISEKGAINIEVKTSRLKNEGYGMWYGAALNIKKCKNKEHSEKYYIHPKQGKVLGDFCYFDYVIFVSLNKSFDPKFYIIPRDFIEKNEMLLRNTHSRFSSATHRIILSDGEEMPKMPMKQKVLIKKTEKFRDNWEQIKK